MNTIVLIAGLIATLIPLLSLYLIYRLDLFSTGDFRFNIFGFLWGGVAFYIAYQANTWLIDTGMVPDFKTLSRFYAPPIEEILKTLLIIYLVSRPKFTYHVDALIWGFAAGIGFAIIENYDYINYSREAALDVAVTRVISTNLVHATGSALIGIALGRAKFIRQVGPRVITLLGGYLWAIGLHTVFNNVVNLEGISFIILLGVAIAIGVGGFFYMRSSVRKGLDEAQIWIKEKLGMEDRVTSGEAKAVTEMENIDELLAPLKDIYGDKKADQIKRFLQLQASIGIRRKKLEELPEGKAQETALQEINKIQEEMDQLRQEVGTYTMAQFRGFFPEGNDLMAHLETAIADRIKKSGGSDAMWKSLEDKSDSKSSSMFDKIG